MQLRGTLGNCSKHGEVVFRECNGISVCGRCYFERRRADEKTEVREQPSEEKEVVLTNAKVGPQLHLNFQITREVTGFYTFQEPRSPAD